jgi:hypothetical protein
MMFSLSEESSLLAKKAATLSGPKDYSMETIPDILQKLANAMQKRRDGQHWPYHLFLTRCLSKQDTGRGYRALARLISQGYFMTILTSNADFALEMALAEQDQLPSYDVLLVGQTSNDEIRAALEGQGQTNGVRIIKLYDHSSQPEREILPAEIQASLQDYFNWDIIVVGCIDQERDAIYALQSRKEDNGIYYIRSDGLSPEDIIVEYLEKQGKRRDDFIITGPDGEFNTFFSKLGRSFTTVPLSLSRPLVPDGQAGSPLERPPADKRRQNQPSVSPTSRAIHVFYVYSPKDKDFLERIEIALRPLRNKGFITEWHKGKLPAGAEKATETQKQLEATQLILLLISPDFINDSENDPLVSKAMKRHSDKNVGVIPVILRPTSFWQDEAFGKLEALPNNQQAISQWSDPDQAYLKVAEGIREAIIRLREKLDEL